jgi:hypothetical protein
MEKEFNYSGSEKGLLLAAFFIGYIFPQVKRCSLSPSGCWRS